MIEERAQLMLQEAQKIEPVDARRAAMIYLDASEIFIYLSRTTNPYEAQNYIEKASQCYEKSQDLRAKSGVTIETIGQRREKTGITFKDIGGLDALKEEIRLKVIEPMKHPDVFKKYGKKVGGGILMYGPPGCGKSLIAEATANEANAAFFHIKASDLKSKYVGETEQNIAKLFSEARERQPSIIFFDEFEVLGGERSRSDPYTRQAVSQLLTEMDGVGSKDQQILLLAATNEPWNIDLALRRSGRFGETIFVPPPDEEARRWILKKQLRDKPMENDMHLHLAELVATSANRSGADIRAIGDKATEYALKDFLRTKRERPISTEDLRRASAEQQSTVIPWFLMAAAAIEERGLETQFPEILRWAQILEQQFEENAVVVRRK